MKRHLVIQLARFGDLIQTKRLLLSLLAREDAEVHLCLDKNLAPLAAILFPDLVLHPLSAHGGNGEDVFAGSRAAFAELKTLAFDQVYNLNYSGLNLALATLFDPDRVYGHKMVNGQHLKDHWLELAFRLTGRRRLGPLNLMDIWGLMAPEPIGPEQVNAPARPGGQGLGVVLAGRNSRRSLPLEQLAAMVNVLAAPLGDQPVFLLGSPAERALVKDFWAASPASLRERLKDLVGRTDWPELIDVVGALDRLVTPDTGTMHLAAHLGVPVEAFFLSSAWAYETGPYGPGHSIWQAARPCLPCLESQSCPYGTACLAPFSSREFLRALAGHRDDRLADGLMLLESRLDSLGVTYEPIWGDLGSDKEREDRAGLRDIMREYCHIPGAEAAPVRVDLVSRLYQERDWMLFEPGTHKRLP